MTPSSPLLALPASIRHKIYTYVLSPSPLDPITTITYTLTWPHLSNPSNTTFAGDPPLSICTCPLSPGSHIYTRHRCTGPTTRFARTPQWLLDSAHGQFNILRPATGPELARRPHAALLRTCKAIHADALPLLYRARTFLLLTGPCPRGRYQAYATLRWLQSVGAAARACVQRVMLLVQPWEEDCVAGGERRSYGMLAAYLAAEVGGLERLVLRVWERGAVDEFLGLVGRGRVEVVLCDEGRGTEVVCCDREAFGEALEGWGTRDGVSRKKSGEDEMDCSETTLVVTDGAVEEDDDDDWVDVTTPTDSLSEVSV